MRTFLALLISALSVQATDVLFNFSDFVADLTTATGRVVIVKPIGARSITGNAIVTDTPRRYTNNYLGTFTATNLYAGTYEASAQMQPIFTFQITIPDTNVTINARDYLTETAPATTYTTGSANNRFVLKTGGVATNLNIYGTSYYNGVEIGTGSGGAGTTISIQTNGAVVGAITGTIGVLTNGTTVGSL